MLEAGGNITVGVHPQVHVFGLAVDTDIVTSTVLAAIILLILGFRMRAKVTDGVPSKLQLMWEVLVEQVNDLADSAIGPKGRRFVPIAVTLFLFILICNWIGFIPSALHPGVSAEILPAPTSDVNLPLAMALFVIAWVHIESFRARGIRGYFRHYKEPYIALAPINVIEEITKPITLTFRLFGNLFSGGLMIAVMVSLLPIFVSPLGELIWKPFDLFIGLIQAYIFMLLTVLYFAFATSTDHSAELETSH
ncbi:MAG TPA: F0F1 ATP synthase subunit A [Acidimicrobiales bacterium]|jgi:F-type H+-transporting ATPase subunit a|nr:F0F1 ATP synthase subunit A [Acidimicrobiales bacterium]